jgi:mRNA interferase MazF
MKLRRGDVHWAELRPRSGSEQSGRRPVVVVSHEIFNDAEAWRSVIVVPCSTSDAQRRRAATVVPIPRGTGGMPVRCVALCHQVTTLDRAKLAERIGSLPRDVVRAIGRGLALALQLDDD